METIGNYPDLAGARVAQGLLASAGIESEVPDEFLSGIDWQMNTALHGVRLRVAPEDAEEARTILESSTAIAEEGMGGPGVEDVCPRCGSASVGPPRWKRRVKALALIAPWLLLVYPLIAVASRGNACYSCGKRWTDREGGQ